MLARSYAAMGRYDDGEKAFGRIGPALEQSPELLGAFAEFLVRKADGDFSGRPRQLIAKALQLDPENMLGLYLAGVDAIQNERWNDTIKYWEPLLKKLEPGSDDAESIGAGLDQARQKVGAGKTAHASAAMAKKPAAAGGKTLSGRVELAPALRAKAKADDVVFIFARAEGGPPMPLAALRLKVAELPYNFTLSDENSLGGAKLSEVTAIRVQARIAKGGTATASPGDLTGQSTVVKPGDKGIRILIENELK
jgi:cytochrome c-type biogenesis protein CcmH